MYYIAQAIGVIALIVAISSFQQNTQKRIVTFQMISSIFFCIHFCMLGAVLGGVLNGIGIFRAAIFRQRDKAWASNKLWFVLLCILVIVAGLFFWEGPISVVPILSMILTTIAFWVKNPRTVRFVTAPASPLWMVYNWYNHSYPGFFTEVFVLSSILVAIVRFDLLPLLGKPNKSA